MSEFGTALRQLRQRQGLRRQEDLVEALDGAIARSTVANLEAGHQWPSPRVWNLLVRRFPEEEAALRPSYERARSRREAEAVKRRQGRPAARKEASVRDAQPDYVFERYDIIYVIRESHSPEEIIEIRRARALTPGSQGYALLIGRYDSPGYRLEPEVIFGGHLREGELHTPRGKSLHIERVDFGRKLRKREVHTFGVRYWVLQDPDPGDHGHVVVETDYRTEVSSVHVNFWGRDRPQACWSYKGFPDEAMAPGDPTEGTLLPLNPGGSVSAEFKLPVSGTHFGIGWRW